MDCLPRTVSLWAVSGVQFPFQKHRTQGAPAVFTFTFTPGLRPLLLSLCFSFPCQLCLLGPGFHCSSNVTLWNSAGISGPGFWNLRAANNLNLGNDALDLKEFWVCWHKTVVISCLLIYLFSIGKLQIRSTGNFLLQLQRLVALINGCKEFNELR